MLLHRYDEQADAWQFRHVTRDQHRAAPFLTDQALGTDPRPTVVARTDAGVPSRGALHFLFHSAFCASTMLVRALDTPGSAMGLSEPVVLNDMVGWRRRGAPPRQHGATMTAALDWLSRPWSEHEAVVVKPSNVFNPLAHGAMVLRPDARAVLLYAPLRPFLLSVARKGLWCRLWVRELLEGYMIDGVLPFDFEARDYFRQSDLQVAAIGWLAQQAMFQRLAGALPGRVATLDSETLTTRPADTVAAVATFYGLSQRDSAAISQHPALHRDSKSGASFTSGQRQADQDATYRAHFDEIDQVVEWAENAARLANIALTLPHPIAI